MHTPVSDTPDLAKIETLSLAFAALALYAILEFGLLSALLSGLLIYQLVQFAAPALQRFGMNRSVGTTLAVTIVGTLIGVAITVGVIELISVLTRGFSNVAVLMQKMADVISTARGQVPAWAVDYLPNNMEEVQSGAAKWLSSNAGQVGVISQDIGKFLFHLIIGFIVGGIVAFQSSTTQTRAPGPLASALIDRVSTLSGAFRSVVFSQVRISALNTTLTSIYLAIVLPMFGVQLPFLKTMIAVTFLAGLLPVLGNLISNTVIVVVSLSVSPLVAASSLAFLVIIHKLEYFVNARIIGTRIRAHAWEILVAMLAMEAFFGLPGLIAAPIYYAYVKDELYSRNLI
ncbi:MAG: AI-2E family transporter [Rhodospirillaceae bacterium]|nr:AI-2E family transporter [Rhodospirillaceae bacterium]